MEQYKDTLSPEILHKRFPEFELELCEKITKNGSWVFVEKGEYLIKGNDHIKQFPLVMDGILRIFRQDENGKETQLYYLNTGEVCAMALSCCANHIKSNINAVVEDDADIMLVPVPLLDSWMNQYPSWKRFVMRSYKERFDELIDTIDSLAFKKMDERLVTFLTEYYYTTGKTEFQGTHEEIARALTSSREVVSRLLKALEKKEKIALGRNRINFKKLIES